MVMAGRAACRAEMEMAGQALGQKSTFLAARARSTRAVRMATVEKAAAKAELTAGCSPC